MSVITDPRAEVYIDSIRAMMDAAAESCNACAIFRVWSKIRTTGNETEVEQGLMVASMALAYWLEAMLEKEPVDSAALDEFCACADALRCDLPDFDRQEQVNQLIVHAGLLLRSHPQVLQGPRHAIIAAFEAYGDMDRVCDVLEASRGVSGAEMAQAVIA